MSLSEWYMKNHCKASYEYVSKRDKRDFNERKAMYNQFLDGLSLPDILDAYSGDYKHLKQDNGYETLIFKDKHFQPDIIRAERFEDDSILFHDRDTKETIALTFKGGMDNG